MTSECLNCNHRDHESNLERIEPVGFLCKTCYEVKSQCKPALHSEKPTDGWINVLDALDALKKPDLINHPPHYQGKGLECIQVIKAFDLNFELGNAIKYILRAGKKGSRKQDLQKAVWYINKQIESLDES